MVFHNVSIHSSSITRTEPSKLVYGATKGPFSAVSIIQAFGIQTEYKKISEIPIRLKKIGTRCINFHLLVVFVCDVSLNLLDQ